MFYCLNIIFSWICLPNSSKNSLSYSNFSHSKYNNNAVFEGINNTEKSRALNNHDAQIKQCYYHYYSFRRRCVFLRVLCFALFNQIAQILVSKPRILPCLKKTLKAVFGLRLKSGFSLDESAYDEFILVK